MWLQQQAQRYAAGVKLASSLFLPLGPGISTVEDIPRTGSSTSPHSIRDLAGSLSFSVSRLLTHLSSYLGLLMAVVSFCRHGKLGGVLASADLLASALSISYFTLQVAATTAEKS